MNELVTQEVATKEVNAWLDFKHVSDTDREDYKNHVTGLIDSVKDGTISINQETFEINQKFKFPFDIGATVLTELKFKPRATTGEITAKIEGMKVAASNGDGRLKAILCVLTGQSWGAIGKMDTVDTKVSNNIVVFFL